MEEDGVALIDLQSCGKAERKVAREKPKQEEGLS